MNGHPANDPGLLSPPGAALLVDLYELTMSASYLARGITAGASFELFPRRLPPRRDWLLAAGCTHVALESTGVYWQPVFNLLEGHFKTWVVNAQHIKKVPGRKTDMKDAEWIAQLMQCGLLRPSFIPDRQQRELAAWNRADLVPAVLEHAGQHLEIGGGVVHCQDTGG